MANPVLDMSQMGQRPSRSMLLAIWRAIEFLLFLSVVGGIGFVVYLYFSQPTELVELKTIRIQGARVLKDDAIIAQSGLNSSNNVLRLEAGEISDRVRRLPYVKTCRVETVYPDLVTITITEREPVATLVVEKTRFEIDDECAVLRALMPGMRNVGPLITNVPDLGYAAPGQRIRGGPLVKALEVWTAFSKTKMAGQVKVSEISAARETEILMYCDELPFEIRWGRGDPAAQAERLDFLWNAKGGQLECGEYLDLRFDNDLICR